MNDWIRIEGQFFRKSAIAAVYVPENAPSVCRIRSDGLNYDLMHHGDDPCAGAKRSRDSIARLDRACRVRHTGRDRVRSRLTLASLLAAAGNGARGRAFSGRSAK